MEQGIVASLFLPDKRAKIKLPPQFSENSYEADTWNDLKAALWCRIINLDQHHLPSRCKSIALKGDYPPLTRMGQGAKEEASLIN